MLLGGKDIERSWDYSSTHCIVLTYTMYNLAEPPESQVSKKEAQEDFNLRVEIGNV